MGSTRTAADDELEAATDWLGRYGRSKNVIVAYHADPDGVVAATFMGDLLRNQLDCRLEGIAVRTHEFDFSRFRQQLLAATFDALVAVDINFASRPGFLSWLARDLGKPALIYDDHLVREQPPGPPASATSTPRSTAAQSCRCRRASLPICHGPGKEMTNLVGPSCPTWSRSGSSGKAFFQTMLESLTLNMHRSTCSTTPLGASTHFMRNLTGQSPAIRCWRGSASCSPNPLTRKQSQTTWIGWTPFSVTSLPGSTLRLGSAPTRSCRLEIEVAWPMVRR